LTFVAVNNRVQTAIAQQPPVFNVRAIPYIGRHFAQVLARVGIFSTRDLIRIAASRADPGANMGQTLAARRQAAARLKDFLSSLTEAPRGARCVSNYYDPPAGPGAPHRTYLVRDINPGAFWALISVLAHFWPNMANRAARSAAIIAMTGGPAAFLKRQDIEHLHQSVSKPRAQGLRSNAAAASCICRRNQASCDAAHFGGAVLCQWLAHGLVAQGLPNWPAAVANGVCLPHPNLNIGSAEPIPGRTRAVERAPYPPAGQAAQVALMGSGGNANGRMARYTRRGGNFQFRNFF